MFRSFALVGVMLLGLACTRAPQTEEASQAQQEASGPALPTQIDVSQLGPQVGDRVPEFSLQDQRGQVRTLDSVMGPRGLMLVFFRSANW